MTLYKKLMITAAAGLVLGTSSCRKFLDVNQNPNIAQTATAKTLLPSCELYLGTALGVDMNIDGSMWAGYWTQNPNASQYRNVEQYAMQQDDFTYSWGNLYSAAENLYQLTKLTEKERKFHYKAVSLVLRAYTFSLLTDGWGDVPYTQALKGQPEDGAIMNPKYDSTVTVYRGIISDIDSALVLMQKTDANGPGDEDLIYHGDMTKWEKFANTLKLRIYLRAANVAPIWSQTGIAALYTAGASFIGTGDDAKISYGFNSESSKNPLYAEFTSANLNGNQNVVGSSNIIDSFNASGDGRAYVFFTTLSNGSLVGLTQGNYNANIPITNLSLPGDVTGANGTSSGGANAPVKFLTSYESSFLQAEALARGWAPATMANEDSVMFATGILQNFNSYATEIADATGNPVDTSIKYYMGDGASIPAVYWATYPVTGTTTDKLRHIITQKWFSMCGTQGYEAWTELRRTGYPDFLQRSVNSQIGTEIPRRFKYPTSESTRNTNFPGLKLTTQKVWWNL